MEVNTINDTVTPDGFYSIWCMRSRAGIVSRLVSKFGSEGEQLTVDGAEKLIDDNAEKLKPLGGFKSEFTVAGIHFNFVGTSIDVKPLPSGALEELERMKESECEGYQYFKQKMGFPVISQVCACNK